MMGDNPNITTREGACLVRLISYLNRSRPALRVGRLLGRQGLYPLSYSRKIISILASNPLPVKKLLNVINALTPEGYRDMAIILLLALRVGGSPTTVSPHRARALAKRAATLAHSAGIPTED